VEMDVGWIVKKKLTLCEKAIALLNAGSFESKVIIFSA